MNQNLSLILGLVLPFLGTTLGAVLVFFMKKDFNPKLKKMLLGFAGGVMVSASFFSLIIPALDLSTYTGKLRILPVAIGFFLGVLVLLLIDNITPHLHPNSKDPEGPKSKLSRTNMLFLAVTIHNVPEGMAVGIVYASLLSGGVTPLSALALAIGIAIQNFPEGAIVSMPFEAEGNSKGKSFLLGVISGIVEPLAAIIMILLKDLLLPAMPYLLSFAAGAMIYVVVEELIPEAQEGPHSNIPTIGFSLGFLIMMILDVVLG
ncbi:MAG: ZIP family metal transporter [Gammaproteobacteria bacterium]|nr:ZIP family metal transporter [Gammaproteobacteria bacterium]